VTKLLAVHSRPSTPPENKVPYILSIHSNRLCLERLLDPTVQPQFASLVRCNELHLVTAWHNCSEHDTIVPKGAFRQKVHCPVRMANYNVVLTARQVLLRKPPNVSPGTPENLVDLYELAKLRQSQQPSTTCHCFPTPFTCAFCGCHFMPAIRSVSCPAHGGVGPTTRIICPNCGK